MNRSSFSLAGWIVETFVSSKLTPLFIIGCALLGAIAIAFTPREENPQINMPAAKIMVSLPGASALEVEELILKPLESVINEIPGIDHVYAMAINSFCQVMVLFEVGEDKEKSLFKLYDKISGKSSLLPPDATPPVIKSIDADDVPIVTITLASEKYDDFMLKRLADRMIERLRSIEEVSSTYTVGGRNREIRIDMDPKKLLSFGITLDQIQNMLSANNIAVPVGSIVEDKERKTLFLNGYFTSVDEVKRLVVGASKNRPIYLEDVAEIHDTSPRERKRLSRFTFGPAHPLFDTTHDPEIPAVTIAVSKKKGTNVVSVAKDIIYRTKRMKKRFIPNDVYVQITRNYGKKANDAINRLIEHLGIAVISVFLVIAFSLGIKAALIVGFTVPLVLSLTLGADFLFGPTINRITLFALILSLGILVDDAIVVIENTTRHYKKLGNNDKRLTTVLSAIEIGNPTNLATAAVMLVFGSLIIITGVIGQYFYPIAFNVPIAMFSSLLVAYIVTPWASNRWLSTQKENHLDHSSEKSIIKHIYPIIISPILDNFKLKCTMFLIVALMIGCSVMQPLWQFIKPDGPGGKISCGGVSLVLLPKDDKNTFNITIDMPENTPVEETDRIARDIGNLLRKNPYVTDYQTYIGMAGVVDLTSLLRGTSDRRGHYVADIRVNLINKHKRSISSVGIVRNFRPLIEELQKEYPGSIVQLVEDPPGPPVRATVLAEIYGNDPKILRNLSKHVCNEFDNTYDLVEVHDSEPEDVDEYRIVVDREKAAMSGVTTAQIAKALHRLVDGVNLGRMHIQGERNPVYIRLHVPREYQIDPDLLCRIFVTNNQGKKVPVSELTRVILSKYDRPILHKDYERVTYVGAKLSNSSPIYAVLSLDKRLDGIKVADGTRLKTGNLTLKSIMPDTIDGYQILWDGEIRMTLDMFRDMAGAFLISIAVIYLLLVGYYKSFIFPLVAMAAIPLAIIGVFPGHWIMGQQFTGASMVGVIALAGVVVRNSLLIIDFVLDNVKQGMQLREAVIQAGAVRARPIILTAMAIVLGIAIMLTDPVFGGLAISLIYGTIASAILTMIVVPVIMYIILTSHEKKEG